jgi:putative phage-type endonuclease
MNDLEELKDISNLIIFEEEPSIFSYDYAVDLLESSLILLDELINSNIYILSEINCKEILLEDLCEIFFIQFEDYIENIFYYENLEEDITDLLEEVIEIYFISFYPEINCNEIKTLNNEEYNIIEKKIQNLREVFQPVQRTEEWYKFRWNLITASNAWKAFESQSTVNQLIYEKCLPLKNISDDINNKEIKIVNLNTPLHWGQKYEPISVLLYEEKYNTKVEDFGCIQHPIFKFLGASPDGIIVDKNSERFGRMLEIKNVVSREINGIPKKEYWIQMQLQMEVCNLDECDFLETKFIEYSNRNDFIEDSTNELLISPDGMEYSNLFLSKENKIKGEIIYFHTKDGKPFYLYKPINCKLSFDVESWEQNSIDEYENEPFNYTYIKTIFWKLEIFSCILVLRNREWFQNNILKLKNVWQIIESERITGYQHRAPIKKNKKEETSKSLLNLNDNQGCLLKFDKIIKL